eukprot:2785045-Pleurochrysis_carterae.AAC.1
MRLVHSARAARGCHASDRLFSFSATAPSIACGRSADARRCTLPQADLVQQYVAELREMGVRDEDIGVITPYNAQADALPAPRSAE